MKICTGCQIEKPFSEFHKRRDTPSGVTARCKNCRISYQKSRSKEKSEYDAEYRNKNREKIKNYLKEYNENNRVALSVKKKAYKNERKDFFNSLDAERDLTIIGRSKKIYNSAKRSAPLRNLSFNLDLDDVLLKMIAGRCARSGIPFDLKRSKTVRNPFAPSIDRINNAIGYEKKQCSACLQYVQHRKSRQL